MASYPLHLQTITKPGFQYFLGRLKCQGQRFQGTRQVLYKGLITAKAGYWISRIAFVSLILCIGPAKAQLVISYSNVIFGVSSDRGDLRESMRHEHRERIERAFAGSSDHPQQSSARRPDHDNDGLQGDQREADNATRRARWQRMSPQEREQMRRDIHQAGRSIYPQNPPREGP